MATDRPARRDAAATRRPHALAEAGGLQFVARTQEAGGHVACPGGWDRLFHGLPVAVGDITEGLRLAPSVAASEAQAVAALLACIALAESGRPAVVYALRVAILYWFSNLGDFDAAARSRLLPRRRYFRLADAAGAWLSWDEAIAAMGRKPTDHAAYLWLLERVEAHCAAQWTATFSSPPLGRFQDLFAQR